ncbi:hypothetical protein, partial [Serratia fonticola]|uniref:hypothetical protein n=1 Tax=Serratia fonticola TaxID=47917 RepID=UPI0034C6120D
RRGEYKERSTDGDKVQKLPGVCAGEMCIRDSPQGEGVDSPCSFGSIEIISATSSPLDPG